MELLYTLEVFEAVHPMKCTGVGALMLSTCRKTKCLPHPSHIGKPLGPAHLHIKHSESIISINYIEIYKIRVLRISRCQIDRPGEPTLKQQKRNKLSSR